MRCPVSSSIPLSDSCSAALDRVINIGLVGTSSYIEIPLLSCGFPGLSLNNREGFAS